MRPRDPHGRRTRARSSPATRRSEQSFATGDAVNVAARLEQAAEPGEIVLGEATYRLVRDAVRAERVEPLALKGKANVVAAWRLVEVLEGALPFARRFDSPLIGRADELAAMLSAFDEAVAQRSRALMTVLGEAGVGKSRLTSEFVTAVEQRATVLGRPLPFLRRGDHVLATASR